ncbi:hypothetical protein [Cereibacter sphaeroides]|uniref:hypothetical protein n=1 Tax=Cereibacter sphaeroides TaxID=1063 RepID=UPI001F2757F9|nr:hypothetical protein [Cereibacter sphaeroides]
MAGLCAKGPRAQPRHQRPGREERRGRHAGEEALACQPREPHGDGQKRGPEAALGRRAAERALDMERGPGLGRILGEKGDHHHRAADEGCRAEGRAAARRPREPVDRAVALERHQGREHRRHGRAAEDRAGAQTGAAGEAGADGRRRIGQRIDRVAEVHQRQPALGLERGDAGVHQHVERPGGRAAEDHRRGEGPERGRLARQHEGRAHGQHHERQRPAPERTAEARGGQHRGHRGHGGEEHHEPEPRLVHAQQRLGVGQGRGEGAPADAHGAEGGEGGTGDPQGAADSGRAKRLHGILLAGFPARAEPLTGRIGAGWTSPGVP